MGDRSLVGQVALVTGGGRGIGRSIVLELAARGASVLLTGREERALGEVVGEVAHAGGLARHVVGDVRDAGHMRTAVDRAVNTWGRLDIAVANAGMTGASARGQKTGVEGSDSGQGSGPAEQHGEGAREIIETNLLGTFHLFDAALAQMRGPGRLIAISSVLGKFGVPGQAAYCASKAGVHGLVRALAAEVGVRGVTCNAICPSWVDTEMARARMAQLAVERGESFEATRERERLGLPLGRFIEPEEVAHLVAFLCSAQAAAITGQALSICCGATLFAG